MRCEDIHALCDQDAAPLPREQSRRVEQHLAHCASCTEAWDVYLHYVALPVPSSIVAALRAIGGLNVVEPEPALQMIASGVPEERISELLGAGHVLLIELPLDGATFINATLLDGASETDVAFLNVMSAERVTDGDWSRQAASIARFMHERFDPGMRDAAAAEARDAVLNRALSDLERVTALAKVPRDVADGVTVLPDDVVLAGVDLANASLDPAVRALTWRVMKGTHHPYIVEPLLQALGSDADADVRSAAAGTLEDFVDQPVVRDALVRARDADVSADVRARAADAQLTDAQRRQRARNEFLDEQGGPANRLRAMLDYARLGPIDDDVAPAMIRFARSETSPSRRGTVWHALGRLRHTAFAEPLLDALQRERDASVRRSVVFGLAGFIDAPQVRAHLVEARDTEPDFDVRRAAAAVLREAAQSARAEERSGAE